MRYPILTFGGLLHTMVLRVSRRRGYIPPRVKKMSIRTCRTLLLPGFLLVVVRLRGVKEDRNKCIFRKEKRSRTERQV